MSAPVSTRHRLIPTRGRSRSFHIWGAVEALHAAEEYVAEEDTPVMVCSAAEGQLVRRLYVISPPSKAAVKTKGRKA